MKKWLAVGVALLVVATIAFALPRLSFSAGVNEGDGATGNGQVGDSDASSGQLGDQGATEANQGGSQLDDKGAGQSTEDLGQGSTDGAH